MASASFIVAALLIVLCESAQALKCHQCSTINKDNPHCSPDKVGQVECGGHFTQCIRIVMNSPAFGEVLRCATQAECETTVPGIVNRFCCTDNLCNLPSVLT